MEAWRDGTRAGLSEPRQRAVLGLLALNPDVPVHRHLLRDRPVRALLTEAERLGAQLIVVGSRGHGEAMTGMGMGSTSRALLYHAECPVAVARCSAEDPALRVVTSASHEVACLLA